MSAPLEIEQVPVGELVPMPGNPRKNEAAIPKVVDSIKRFGWTSPILARREDRVVVAGHTRLAAAKQLGVDKVPVIWLDLSPTDSRLYNLADNKLSEVADWDNDALASMLRELSTEDAAGLEIAGFGDDELAKLLSEVAAEVVPPGAEPDDVPAPQDEPYVKQGDLWALGQHRILCGDCRNFSDVQRLLDGKRINVAVTSPPYAAQRAYDESSGFKPIPPDQYVEWYRDVSANVLAHLADDGSYFVNIKEHCEDGQRSLYVKDLTIAHVREWGWRFVDEFCWKKNAYPGDFKGRFKNGWEPIFHFARSAEIRWRAENVLVESSGKVGATHAPLDQTQGSGARGSGRVFDGARPSNVVECSGTGEALGHSAAYPVALPEFFIKAFSDTGDVVFDPFMGSGTTLIAAEKNGRVAFGTEISPRYAQVIIERWQKFTGKKAERIG